MFRNHFVLFGTILFVAAAVGGCGNGSPPPKDGDNPGAAANGKKPDEPALPELKGDVSLDVASWDEVKEKIASHKGKVVVLDLWSNWCDPCLKAFPGLVKLQRKHADDVVCMSLNLNYSGDPPSGPTDEHKADALKFLKDKGAKFPNFLSSVPDEKVYELAEITTVPTVLVFDAEGKVAKTFEEDPKQYGKGGFTYEKHITPFVETLLGKSKP